MCISLFLCCLFCNKTKWFSCLHPVVLLPFYSFGEFGSFVFHSSQKTSFGKVTLTKHKRQ